MLFLFTVTCPSYCQMPLIYFLWLNYWLSVNVWTGDKLPTSFKWVFIWIWIYSFVLMFEILHQHVKSTFRRPKNSDYGIFNEGHVWTAPPVTHRCTVGAQPFLDPDRWTAKMATRRPIDCVCLAIDWPRSEGAHHSLSCSNVSSSPIHLHLSTALLGLISSTAPLVYIVVNPFITLHVS